MLKKKKFNILIQYSGNIIDLWIYKKHDFVFYFNISIKDPYKNVFLKKEI